VLALKGIEAGYGRIRALHGIDLEVRQGEIVTLLGANGAGKTTTLKTISGLVRPSAGSILFEGQELVGRKASDIARLGVVHVPEGRHVLKGLSVRENLELGGFTVPDARGRREQQMLAIGRALMHGPRVLLLDEPSMGLAPKLVIETFRIIKELNRTGVTILLVEQNARLALKLANYGYVLETGNIRMDSDADILSASNSIVEAYLGT
jgi:branched-chain amino acid transport system ATP-binding protein